MKTLLLSLLALLAGALAPAQTVIKMGTLAPDGSEWHLALQRMGERWRQISGGRVKLVIYPGGSLGDEPDLVRKMRIGQIQSVALSGGGMVEIDRGVMALQIPMLLDSYEELDYVRDRLAPKLDAAIEAKGFVVLNWADAGWVHFFSRKPIQNIGDLRQMKLFCWAGDSSEIDLWRSSGFRPEPLAATDILNGLQTGLIDVVPNPPLFALLNQSFGLAHYMADVKWAPLVGATMVTKAAWDKLPASDRPAMLEAGRAAGVEMRASIRKMGDEAVAAMQKRKLQVVHLSDAAVAEMRRETENAWPKMRGSIAPADLFDQARRLRDEFRASRRPK